MQSEQQGQITDINVTPLVDVCLVLVIIFMVLAPFAMQAGIEIASTRMGASRGRTSFKENVNISLDGKGIIKVNGKTVAWPELGQTVARALELSRDKLVGLNASPEASVGQVVEILDTSKQSGAKRLAVLNP